MSYFNEQVGAIRIKLRTIYFVYRLIPARSTEKDEHLFGFVLFTSYRWTLYKITWTMTADSLSFGIWIVNRLIDYYNPVIDYYNPVID